MEIKVRDLRRLIREALLREYTVSGNATLYHRSPQKFKVGDILTAQVDPATGKHWQAKKKYEQEMEEYRKKNHPDLPSRFNCIFASFSPRSRFIGKGFLYAIKPIGKMHVTDSKFIDQIGSNSWKGDDYGYDSSYIEDYWKGVEPRRGNINDMEILMDQAEVIEVIEEQQRIFRGMNFSIGPGVGSIVGTVGVSTRKDGTTYVFASNGNDMIPADEGLERLKAPGIKLGEIKKKSYGDDKEQIVHLGPGFSGVVVTYRGSEPGAQKESYLVPSISVSPGSAIGSDGISIRLDDESCKNFIRSFRKGQISKRG